MWFGGGSFFLCQTEPVDPQGLVWNIVCFFFYALLQECFDFCYWFPAHPFLVQPVMEDEITSGRTENISVHVEIPSALIRTATEGWVVSGGISPKQN